MSVRFLKFNLTLRVTKRGRTMRVGYVRVSSVDQNTFRQLDGVEVERSFTDAACGKDTDRPKLHGPGVVPFWCGLCWFGVAEGQTSATSGDLSGV
jgi:hypothetical protein